MEDYSFLDAISSPSPNKVGRKKGKKEKPEEDLISLSDKSFETMMTNPMLKYKGQREIGEAIIYKCRKTKEVESNAKQAERFKYLMDLSSKIPGGYTNIAGVYVQATPEVINYILPRPMDGAAFYRWKLNHWSEVVQLTMEG